MLYPRLMNRVSASSWIPPTSLGLGWQLGWLVTCTSPPSLRSCSPAPLHVPCLPRRHHFPALQVSLQARKLGGWYATVWMWFQGGPSTPQKHQEPRSLHLWLQVQRLQLLMGKWVFWEEGRRLLGMMNYLLQVSAYSIRMLRYWNRDVCLESTPNYKLWGALTLKKKWMAQQKGTMSSCWGKLCVSWHRMCATCTLEWHRYLNKNTNGPQATMPCRAQFFPITSDRSGSVSLGATTSSDSRVGVHTIV